MDRFANVLRKVVRFFAIVAEVGLLTRQGAAQAMMRMKFERDPH